MSKLITNDGNGMPRWHLDSPHRQKPQPSHQANSNNISDPFIRELVRKREEVPHYLPAPLDATVKGVDLERVTGHQREVMRAGGAFDLGEADLAAIFQRRQQQQQQQQPQAQQQQQQATLRVGAQVFRPLQQSFGNMLTLARFAGQVDPALASQPVLVKREVSAYVVQPNQTQVNIQEIQSNPRLLTQFVEIQLPPMTSQGPLLVLREALVVSGQYPGGRSMLVDSRIPSTSGRTILKG